MSAGNQTGGDSPSANGQSGVDVKVPPPPPGKRPTDLITQAEAARITNRSSSWVCKRIKEGDIPFHGLRRGVQGGYPGKLVSHKEVLALSKTWPRREPSVKPNRTAAKGAKSHGVAAFGREEVRDFAKNIMVELLNASSITITVRNDGAFDVLLTPRAPAAKGFVV